jgi:hypothetical protein
MCYLYKKEKNLSNLILLFPLIGLPYALSPRYKLAERNRSYIFYWFTLNKLPNQPQGL